MDYQQITTEDRDGVALLTLDRPERLNAWTPRMAEELAHAIERANGAETDLGLVQQRESEMLRKCWESPEHHAAVNAFLERSRKRK